MKKSQRRHKNKYEKASHLKKCEFDREFDHMKRSNYYGNKVKKLRNGWKKP